MILNRYGQPYKAAEFNELTSNLPADFRPSVDEHRWGVLCVLRSRSRYLYRNHAHARGAIDTRVRLMCGGGLGLQGRQRTTSDGRFNQAENQAVEAIFREWSRRGITPNGLTFDQTVKLAARHQAIDGEVLLIRNENPDRAIYGDITREFQIVRSDMLPDGTEAAEGVPTGNVVDQGIETDRQGRIIAYHIYSDGYSVYWAGADPRMLRRVPAELVTHWKAPEFADARRGLPLLTPVVLYLADLNEYLSATLTQAWAQSNTVAFIKSMLSAEREEAMNRHRVGVVVDSGIEPRRSRMGMTPGTMEFLLPGEEVTFADPKSPGSNLEPFTAVILRAIAAGVGLSYELLARDYTKTNYSSGRLVSLQDEMAIKEICNEMDEALIVPIWRDVVDHVYTVNRLRPMPASANIYDLSIMHPKVGWVDPLKEQQAIQMAIDSRTMSRTEACRQRGVDFENVIDELAQENAYMASKGVTESPEAVRTSNSQVVAKIIEMEMRENAA